jgi:hypothetical protein
MSTTSAKTIETTLAAKMAAITTTIDHTDPSYYERAVSTEPRLPSQPLGRRNPTMGITIRQYWGHL